MRDARIEVDIRGLPESAIIAGRFRLEQRLGIGGGGVVFGAVRLSDGARVAVKLLRPDRACNSRWVRRFMREGYAVSQIASEHVARVLEVHVATEACPFIVMELLDGEDLARRLGRLGPLPVREAVDAIVHASLALRLAHAAGIVHRDLKPSNLFRTRCDDGSHIVKVLDFGIAKLADELHANGDSSLTQTGTALGSPRYMSPEQIRGTGEIDCRTDIWSIGITLFELLTNAQPFGSNDNALTLYERVVHSEPHSLVACRAEVPVALEAVVRRCIQKNPALRYQSIDELLVSLLPFVSGEERANLSSLLLSTTRTESTERTTPRGSSALRRSSTGLASAFTLVAAALMVGGGSNVEARMKTNPATPSASRLPALHPSSSPRSVASRMAPESPWVTAEDSVLLARPKITAKAARGAPRPTSSRPDSGRVRLPGGSIESSLITRNPYE